MPHFAANLTLLFNELPFLERFEAAAAAGFRGVEFLFPYDETASDIAAALGRHNLAPVLFNAPPGDWGKGERGLAAVAGEEARFRASLDLALTFAAAIKPRGIHIMAGLAEGPQARTIYVENLRWACRQAPEQRFLIEPLNTRDNPGYHLTHSDAARAVIEAVGAPNLMLQYDLYHAQIMEGDLTRRIEALAPILGHVQVGGVPERHEPDRGELAIHRLMETLDRIGYEGWVSLEYHPAGRTEDGLGWLKPWLED